LNKPLSIHVAAERLLYFEMLDLADDLYQRKAINEHSLIELTIARCPPSLRTLLVKHTMNDGEWYIFLRQAKENAWLVFTEEMRP
ncbi:hypothetical protein COBT_004087, partial [Conglomerata obtusa]